MFWNGRNDHGFWADPNTGLIFTSFGQSSAQQAGYEESIGRIGGNLFFGTRPFPRPAPRRSPVFFQRISDDGKYLITVRE
jgi:hypothetical protein